MKVSVVTPSFNSASTIGACIQSVKAQTYPGIEHIVIDGGSTDQTRAILDSYSVSYISEPDAGIYDAMNKGVQRSSGDVIAILNSDDAFADKDVIADVVRLMEVEGIDLCHSKIIQVDPQGRPVWLVGRPQTKEQLLRKMRVAHPGVFVRRAVYQRYGGFSVGFRIAGDYDFLLRVWGRVRIGFVDRVTVRMGMGGASGTAHSKSLREAAVVSILHGRSFFGGWGSMVVNLFTHAVVTALRAGGVRRV